MYMHKYCHTLGAANNREESMCSHRRTPSGPNHPNAVGWHGMAQDSQAPDKGRLKGHLNISHGNEWEEEEGR